MGVFCGRDHGAALWVFVSAVRVREAGQGSLRLGDIGTGGVVQGCEGDLTFAVSDEELEAAASPVTNAAMTFPSAPTVGVLFVCCGNEYHAGATRLKS